MNTCEYDTLSAAQVAEAIARELHPSSSRKSERSRVRVGIIRILGPIESHVDAAAGSTWEERWYLADGDQLLLEYAATFWDSHMSKHERAQFNDGLKALVTARVIRPGIVATTAQKIGLIVSRAIEPEHAADFQRVLSTAGSVKQLSPKVVPTFKAALAAMILFTGKPLSQITPAEWVTADRIRQDVVRQYSLRSEVARRAATALPEHHRRFTTVSLHNAYAACVNSNLIAADLNPASGMAAIPPTLADAARPTWTVDWVLESRGKRIGPNVTAMLRDVLTIKHSAYDNSSITAMIGRMSMLTQAIRLVDPDLDTLDIPFHVADQALAHLRTAPVANRRPGTKRVDIAGTLYTCRTLWKMCNSTVQRHAALKAHQSLLGEFPFDDDVIREISRNERKRRQSRLHEQVRRQVHHIDHLVEATQLWLTQAEALAQRALITPPGEFFDYNGTSYQRSTPPKGFPSRTGQGRPVVAIRVAGRKRFVNVEEDAMRAARDHLLMVVLRETAVRIEELAELSLDDLQPMSNGADAVPLIAVNPSKLDKGRTIPCTPQLLAALHAHTRAVVKQYGHYPRSTRYDQHEHEIQAPAQLFFFQYRKQQFTGFDDITFRGWLNSISERYDAEVNNSPIKVGPLQPHGMRRAVATDLHDRGAPLAAIQQLLGHANLATTNTYIKPDEQQAIFDIVAARRRPRPRTRLVDEADE